MLAATLSQKGRPERVVDGEIDVFLPDGPLQDSRALARELEENLQAVYNRPWRVTVTAFNEVETNSERNSREKAEMMEQARNAAPVRQLMRAFPGAEVVDILPDTQEGND